MPQGRGPAGQNDSSLSGKKDNVRDQGERSTDSVPAWPWRKYEQLDLTKTLFDEDVYITRPGPARTWSVGRKRRRVQGILERGQSSSRPSRYRSLYDVRPVHGRAGRPWSGQPCAVTRRQVDRCECVCVNLTLSDKVARIALYDLLGRDDGGRMWAESLLREMGITNESAIARGFIRSLTQIDPHHIRSLFAELIEYDQRGELSSIQCPTLIVRGSHDNFVPVYCALELHRLIAGSELVSLNGCGHLPYLEDPALFNRIVEQFIGRK
jgi:pimeloyl-ACP methyl ester carboxylesterase